MFGDPVIDNMKWGQQPLSYYLKNIRYGTSVPPQFSDNGYAFIRATNIKDGNIVNNDMKYISLEEASKIKKCKLSGGEMIIVRSGINSGDTCIITDEYIGQYAGYDLILDFKKSINPIFVNTLINTQYMNKVVKPLTRRAAQPHLNSEQVQGIPIIQVPIHLQNEFADFVQQVDKLKFELQNSLDELNTLNKALMQKYFG
jgi:type I restriction enzyme S subunit